MDTLLNKVYDWLRVIKLVSIWISYFINLYVMR